MSESISSIVGGKWWKVDFHLHTPASYDYGHGDDKQKKISATDFLKTCRSKGLDCIVVTDHNTFSWIPELRKALVELKASSEEEYTHFTIFPGIEINAQGNVHLLGIFDPSFDYEQLVSIFGKFDFNKESETTEKSLAEIMNIIHREGGIAIPAHVNDASGLFKAPASVIKTALQVSGLLAFESSDEVVNELYKETKLHLSYVLGSDSHSLDTIASQYTWVKMGEPNIEAMRLALYDAEDGVIRSIDNPEDPNSLQGRTYIQKLTIENGRYIGRQYPYEIRFSPWLNSIIGGRGTGKSSILTFIRMALGRGDELPESIKEEYDNFARAPKNRSDLGMLLSTEGLNTSIMIDFCVDGIRHRLRWNNSAITEYSFETNEWNEAIAIHDRFPVRMFSQKQLFEMTSDPELLFKYLDDVWDYSSWKEKIAFIRNEYLSVANHRRSLIAKAGRKEELKKLLEDLSGKIAVFETDKTKRVLEKKEELQKAKGEIRAIYSRTEDYITAVQELSRLDNISDSIESHDLDEQTREEITIWIKQIVSMQKEIKGVISKYADNLIDVDSLICRLHIGNLLTKNASELEEVMEELRASGVDNIDKYTELLGQKDKAIKDIEDIGSVEEQIEQCNKKLQELRQQIRDLIAERSTARVKVINQWNKIGPLKVTLLPLGSITKNEMSFRSLIRKDTEFGQDILEYDSDGNLTGKGILYAFATSSGLDEALLQWDEIYESLKGDHNTFGKRFAKHLQQLFDNSPEALDEIAVWVPEDDLKLEINVNHSGKPAYKDIDAGSPGQRTSAILSLIFGISEMPIVIDQPEDDLDTRNITDIVVNSINQMKKRQQIILVTHNPNIVVNTNSEQITQLDYVNGQIITACAGALQSHDVRDAICEVMEGGKEALEKRYYRIFKALQ